MHGCFIACLAALGGLYASQLMGVTTEKRDELFWINLDRRKDRREKMEKLLGGVGLRVEGVDGSLVSEERGRAAVLMGSAWEGGGVTIVHDGAGKLKEFRGVIGKGAVGCALSHRKAWRAVISNNLSTAVILEDDLTWAHPILTSPSLFEKLHSLTVPWDLIYLSYHGCITTKHPPTSPLTQPLHPTNATWYSGLYTYAVHGPTSAAKLLQNWPLTAQIDKHIAIQCLEGGLICYRVPPSDCISNSSLSEETLDSDVQVFRVA